MSRPPSDPPPGRRPEGSPGDGRPPSPTPNGSSSWIRYLPWVLVLLLVGVFFIPGLSGGSSDSKKLSDPSETDALMDSASYEASLS